MELVEGRSLREILNEIEQTGAINVVIGEAPQKSEVGPLTSPPGGGDDVKGRRGKSEVGTEASAATDSALGNPQSEIGGLPRTRLGSSSAADKAYYRRVAEWMTEVAEALHYAHEQSVIHRDVKPSNLLLANNGRLMISDFGLAKATGIGAPGDDATVTASRALLGTARYMSPEQVSESGPAIDTRVDVYGLGATLYELLAFRPMFAAADDREVLDCVLNREPTPPRRFAKQVPRELETICLKAVEKQREVRYETAKAMADDLRRWLLDLPIHAKRPGPLMRAGKFVRRRKLPVTLAAVATLSFVMAVFLYSGYSSSQREAAESQSRAAERQTQVVLRDARRDYLVGDFNGARTKVDDGLTQDPDSVELLRLRGDILHCQGSDDEALAIFEELLARDPDDWETHYSMTFLLARNERSPVVTYIRPERAASTMPPDERARRIAHHRGEVIRLQPDSAEAYYLRAKIEPDPHRALPLLDEATDRDSLLSEALLARSRIHHQLGDYEAMLLDAERVLSRHPGWGVFHGNRALALSELGRYAEAEDGYSDAIRCDPHYAAWWHGRCVQKCRLGRYAEALADANRAVELDPEFAYAYLGRAWAQSGLGRIDLALADYDQALRFAPGDAQIFMERAGMHFRAGNLEAAADDMDRVIELKPDDAAAYGDRAVVFILMKRYDRAISDLTRSIVLDPGNPDVWRNRGHARALNEQYVESIADYTRAIELRPGEQADLSSRASLFTYLGRYEEAVADLTELLKIDSSPAVFMQRGMLYELVGAERLALADYERVCPTNGRSGAYGRLWRYILLRDSGHEAAVNELQCSRDTGEDPASRALGQSGDGWTARLSALFAGELAPDDLFAAAATDDERAEAQYYIGRKALLDGDPAAARTAFEKCVALERNGILETDFARAMLDAVDTTAPETVK